MSELPYRSEHVNDAIANSEELSNEELGAYVRLQRAFWKAGGYLPAKELGRFARAGKRWAMLAPAILRKLTVIEGSASCPCMLATLLDARQRRAAAAERAAKGGAAKAAKYRSGVVSAPSQKVPLNAPIPLNSHNGGVLEALIEQSFEGANQNPILRDSKTLSKSNIAAGGRESESATLALNERLYGNGVGLLRERVGITALAAKSQIAKWIAAVGDSEVADLLEAAAGENLRSARFVAIIDQRVRARSIERRCGGTLPFGMHVIGGKT